NQQESLSSLEFKTILHNLMDSVDVTFNEDLNWSIMLKAFESLQRKYQFHKIQLKSVEANSNFRFIVKIRVQPSTENALISQSFRQEYDLLALGKQKFNPAKHVIPVSVKQNSQQELLNSYEQN
ncbi:MAG: hypothetical protein HC930_09815, partial [Hydrococcus sp. SU_1_0]|nr:hypothetical protein [Hydrococcus sp. SU_1_0]